MTPADAARELEVLERSAREAAARFAQAPGGLWLVGSAVLERLARHPVDAARTGPLRELAQRMQSDGEARASSHELAALGEWIALARRRAALEEVFVDTLTQAALSCGSRAELEAHLSADASASALPPLPPAAQALVAELRAERPEYDPLSLPAAFVAERAREASARLGGRGGELRWSAKPGPRASVLLGLASLACLFAALVLGLAPFLGPLPAAAGAAVLVALAVPLALAAVWRRRREIARRAWLLEVWGLRVVTERDAEGRRHAHERWLLAARALGQLDAYRRAEEGVGLEAREQRLPALAPWVRVMTGGFDEERARAFA